MNAIFSFTAPAASLGWLELLLDASVKALAILALTGAATLLLRRSSAAMRHLVWTLGVLAVLCMPLLSAALPQWQLSLLPAMNAPATAPNDAPLANASATDELELEAGSPAADPARRDGPERQRTDSLHPFRDAAPTGRGARVGAPPHRRVPRPLGGVRDSQPAGETRGRATATTPDAPPAPSIHWSAWVLLGWAAGVLLCALPLVVGTLLVRRRVARAARVADPAALALLDDLRASLGIRRPVALRRSAWRNIPLTCGILRPVIILPAEADTWSDQRRRVEREQACDDLVLAAGHKASEYASHLLEIVRTLRSMRCPALAAVAMARRSQFEGRMLAILDPRRNRRALTRVGALAAVMLLAAVAIPLACVSVASHGPATSNPVDALPAGPMHLSAPGAYILRDQRYEPIIVDGGVMGLVGREVGPLDMSAGDAASALKWRVSVDVDAPRLAKAMITPGHEMVASLDPAGELLVLSDGQTVTALDVRQRKLRWQRPVVDYGFEHSDRASFAEGVMVLADAGGRLAAVRMSDGEQLWRTSLDLPRGDLLIGAPRIGGGLLGCRHDRWKSITCVSFADGSVLRTWNATIKADVRATDELFVVQHDATIEAFRPDDLQQPAWTRTPYKQLPAFIADDAERLAICPALDSSELAVSEVISLGDGQPIARLEMGSRNQPNRFAVGGTLVGDALYVYASMDPRNRYISWPYRHFGVGGMAVEAFALPSGQRLWSTEIDRDMRIHHTMPMVLGDGCLAVFSRRTPYGDAPAGINLLRASDGKLVDTLDALARRKQMADPQSARQRVRLMGSPVIRNGQILFETLDGLTVQPLPAECSESPATQPATPATRPAPQADSATVETDEPIFDIPRLEGIEIDGSGDDWAGRGFLVKELGFARGGYQEDSADFDTQVRLAWNDRGLLVLVETRDDVDFEHADGRQLYRNDCVELYYGPQYGAADFAQVIYGPGFGADFPELRQDIWERRKSAKLLEIPFNPQGARRVTDGGYVLEVLLPWEPLAIEPALGAEVTFQAYVQDSDADDEGHQRVFFPSNLTPHVGTNALMRRLRLSERASEPFDARDLGSWLKGPTIDLQVTDAQSDEPLGEAEVSVQVYRKDNSYYWVQQADEAGRCTVPLPAGEFRSLRIYGRADGHVQTRVTWEDPAAVPQRYALALEPTRSIGGVVRNEDGEGVAGAKLYFMYFRQRGQTGEDSHSVALSDPGYHADYIVETDERGRWSSDRMPEDLTALRVRYSHPDYISDNIYTQPFTPAALRDGSAVLVLKRGLTLEGRVTDAEGKPTAGADVMQGQDRVASNPPPATKTDADGRYHFGGVKPGELVLTARAKGFAPDLRRLQITPEVKTADFTLEPGNVLRGRVVDTDGNPIAGAGVAMDTWRGCRTLAMRVSTDSEGRFEWTDAPSDEVLVDVFEDGYMSTRRQALTAGETEPVITLVPVLSISGTVVDDETGEPVEQFRLIEGIRWDDVRPPYWSRDNAKTQRDGRYEVSFDYPYPGHLVRIEAEGYVPAVSRVFKSDEGEQTHDFRLTRGEGLSGVVRLPGGTPAEGAQVTLVTPGRNAYIQNGRESRGSDCATTRTNADGKYQFPPESGKWLIVAFHDGGYAELHGEDVTSAADITLAPWARVTGRLMIGVEPGGGEGIVLRMREDFDRDEPRVFHDIRTTSDSDGRFAFDRVPPGKVTVGREIATGPNMRSIQQMMPLELAPGEETDVALGGSGRPIIGRVVVPDGREVNLAYGMHSMGEKIDLPKPPYPEDWETMDADVRREWAQQWRATDEGKAYEQMQQEAYATRRSFSFGLNADGTFRIEDIPAGEYTLSIQLHEPPTSGSCGFGDALGRAHTEVVVPEMPDGRSDEPLDVGELELTLFAHLEVGDEAPPFEVPTLDGGTLSLADFRGKYVLLDFWATWCGPCIGEMPHLQAVHEAFAGDERLVMISLSLDKEMDAPRSYAEKNSISWPQGFLGEWSKAKLPDQYAVRGIPAVFLIGPDGRLVAKGLRGEKIADTVAEALGPPQHKPATQPASNEPERQRGDSAESSARGPRAETRQASVTTDSHTVTAAIADGKPIVSVAPTTD